MPSPFPGMDPYLEGYLSPDVHHRLATQISDQLAPRLEPNYVARIVLRTVMETWDMGESIGVVLPDVEIFRGRETPMTPTRENVAVVDVSIAPAPIIAPQYWEYEVEIPSVEIRTVKGGVLVASIEIMSPTNKTGQGWNEYHIKRTRVLESEAHLLEIDLLRRGKRPVPLGPAPLRPYYVFLTRARHRTRVEIWPISLRDPLPTVPVPLRAPDPDVALNLQLALTTVYDRARYHLSIDYHQPAEYPLEEFEAEWAATLVK